MKTLNLRALAAALKQLLIVMGGVMLAAWIPNLALPVMVVTISAFALVLFILYFIESTKTERAGQWQSAKQ